MPQTITSLLDDALPAEHQDSLRRMYAAARGQTGLIDLEGYVRLRACLLHLEERLDQIERSLGEEKTS